MHRKTISRAASRAATAASILLALPVLAAAALAAFTGITARRVEKALPPTGRFISVEGGTMHIVEAGAGPPIVMIHGLGGQTRNFSFGVASNLARANRVVLLDRPGSGYSPRAALAPANLTAQAASIASLIRALGLERPLLVGHSLGGAVALAVALDHPDCARGLALISPLTRPLDAVPPLFDSLAIRSRFRRWLVGWTIAAPIALSRGAQTMQVMFGPDPAVPAFATIGGGLLGLRPSSFYSSSTDFVEAGIDLPAMSARYGSLSMPVGVLYGTGDRILDYQHHGTALEGVIPDLQIELIEQAGHMLPISAPDQVVSFIERVAARCQREA